METADMFSLTYRIADWVYLFMNSWHLYDPVVANLMMVMIKNRHLWTWDKPINILVSSSLVKLYLYVVMPEYDMDNNKIRFNIE